VVQQGDTRVEVEARDDEEKAHHHIGQRLVEGRRNLAAEQDEKASHGLEALLPAGDFGKDALECDRRAADFADAPFVFRRVVVKSFARVEVWCRLDRKNRPVSIPAVRYGQDALQLT